MTGTLDVSTIPKLLPPAVKPERLTSTLKKPSLYCMRKGIVESWRNGCIKKMS